MDVRQTNDYVQNRQQQFRKAAVVVAQALAKCPEVQKIVLFGSVAMPLEKEVPRFREYRRARIAVLNQRIMTTCLTENQAPR